MFFNSFYIGTTLDATIFLFVSLLPELKKDVSTFDIMARMSNTQTRQRDPQTDRVRDRNRERGGAAHPSHSLNSKRNDNNSEGYKERLRQSREQEKDNNIDYFDDDDSDRGG